MPTLTESPTDSLVKEGFAEVAEAQQYLRLSRATIYAMMEAGDLAYARFGRRRRIPWRVLYDFAAGRMTCVAK